MSKADLQEAVLTKAYAVGANLAGEHVLAGCMAATGLGLRLWASLAEVWGRLTWQKRGGRRGGMPVCH